MSVLTYGNVRMQIQKTESFYFSPIYTEDGTDYLYTELDLAVLAVVNQQALATRGAGNLAIGPNSNAPFLEDAPAGATGDPIGTSLANLRPMLLTPRQALTFSINNNIVLIIPAGGDARNGPLPQRDTYVRYILGTQTAMIYFHVKAWVVEMVGQSVATLPHVVLANRYRVTSTTNEDYYATRYISGQMIVDAGALSRAAILLGGTGLTPDSFRQAAFLQIPTGFKRQNVQVNVSSDNTTLDYSYTDQETPLAFGPATMVTRIQGSVSTGISSPLGMAGGMTAIAAGAAGNAAAAAAAGVDTVAPTLRSRLSSAIAIVGGIFGAPASLGGGAAQGVLHPSNAAANITAMILTGKLPKIVAAGNVRIWGQRGANKLQLTQLAIQIILDRLATSAFVFINSEPRIGTISVTQDVVERFVEVNMTMVNAFTSQIGALGYLPSAVLTTQNWQSNVASLGYAGTSPIMDSTILGINPPPSITDPTRGDWLGALVTALLGTPGSVPITPPDPALNLNQAVFF